MSRSLILFISLLLTQTASPQSFTVSLYRIETLPLEEREAALDGILPAVKRFPLAETDTTILFLFHGEARNVFLAGDETDWKATIPFTRIEGTGYWHLERHYDRQARLDYKIVVNDTLWMLDPLNPDTCLSGFGPNSTFGMPGYTSPPELYYQSGIPHGTVKDTIFHSDILGNDRRLAIYLPAGYDPANHPFPVILFHDGLEFLELIHGKNILDNLIAGEKIRPLIAVFVEPVNREAEYTGNGKREYRDFILRELMPWIDQQYNTSHDNADRAMLGISNGGNISLYIGITASDQFGKIAAMSSNYEKELFLLYGQASSPVPELYLDMGIYDIPGLKPLVRKFVELLDDHGDDYRMYWYPEGHSWGNWEGHLRVPLMQFFPLSSGAD